MYYKLYIKKKKKTLTDTIQIFLEYCLVAPDHSSILLIEFSQKKIMEASTSPVMEALLNIKILS